MGEPASCSSVPSLSGKSFRSEASREKSAGGSPASRRLRPSADRSTLVTAVLLYPTGGLDDRSDRTADAPAGASTETVPPLYTRRGGLVCRFRIGNAEQTGG